MHGPHSGDAETENTPLRSMRLVSKYLDANLIELERVLSSAQNLVPEEEFQPKALQLMNEELRELKDLEESACNYRDHLKKMLAEVRRTNEEANALNKNVEDGIREFEVVLEKFGYDGSKFPPYTSGMFANSGEGDTDNADGSISSGDEESLHEDVRDCPESSRKTSREADQNSPVKRDSSVLNEYMAGMEITPLVCSSKSDQSNSRRRPLTPATPSTQFLKIPSKYVSEKYNPHTSPVWSPSKEKFEASQKADVVLVKPTPPILSQTTYDLLGIKPPPEFYEQQKS